MERSTSSTSTIGGSLVDNFLRISRGLSQALPPETLRFRESLLRSLVKRKDGDGWKWEAHVMCPPMEPMMIHDAPMHLILETKPVFA